MFDNHISNTIAELDISFGEYKARRKELIDNVEHCTSDTTGLRDEINADKIGDKYGELKQKYDGYKKESVSKCDSIVSLVLEISTKGIETNIDQLSQQKATRTLFQTLRGNCIELAEFITKHMKNLENDMKDFNGAVDDYLINTIRVLRKRLIACINRSIDETFDRINQSNIAIDVPALTRSVGNGDGVIDEISGLLAKLEEADSP
jgi:hypothetical protein